MKPPYAIGSVPSCVTPAGTSNELDVQNEWEENTHTHTLINYVKQPTRYLIMYYVVFGWFWLWYVCMVTHMARVSQSCTWSAEKEK